MTQAALDKRETCKPTRFHIDTIKRSDYDSSNFDVTWKPVLESRLTLSHTDGRPLDVLAEFERLNPPPPALSEEERSAHQNTSRDARAAARSAGASLESDAPPDSTTPDAPDASSFYTTICDRFASPMAAFFTRSPLSYHDDSTPSPRACPEQPAPTARTLSPDDFGPNQTEMYAFLDIVLPSGATPLTFKQAMSSLDRKHWRFAINAEYEQLIDAATWEHVPRSEARNVISGKWIFKIKKNADGSIDRYKARWVARGFSQRKDIDYTEIFSPVIKYSSLRLLLSLANTLDLDCYGLDVSNAFARATVTERLYVDQPTGFEARDPQNRKYVCRLNTALYGTKQAARLWNQMLRKHLLADGWRQYETDSCIYSRETAKYGLEFVGVYVDDILHICKGSAAHKAFHTYCEQAFPTTTQGELTWILGMEIKRNRATRTLTLNQTHAVISLLEDCQMRDARPLSSPMDPQWKYGNEPKTANEKLITQYRSRVGSLMHIQQCTRPDISLAVNKLCRHMSDPNPACFTALNHILRYLAGTPHLGIKYFQGNSTSLKLEAFTDSTYGGENSDKAKSQTGNIFYFGGGPIDWVSCLQPIIALSSCEAEQVAAFNASRSCVHFRQLLEELGHTQLNATTVWCDNTAAIAQSKNMVKASSTRHVLIQYHYLRDLTESGIVRLEYVCTLDQIADILTKPLTPKLFNDLVPFIVSPSNT
jgi:hypothetical protein